MEKKTTSKLKQKIWSKSSYYSHATAASRIEDHPGLVKISDIAKRCQFILEVGCGEGSKLAQIVPENAFGFGVDFSEKAIILAKKKYSKLNFTTGDIIKLPFGDNKFDLTYSAFVLEHLEIPEKAIFEQIRVTKSGGKLAFIAPNFGAPNRASPCFLGNRIIKLAKGLILDFIYFFLPLTHLNWLKVQPRFKEKYQIDFDTQVEPYLLTLKKFLETKKIKALQISSFWRMDLKEANILQKIFRFFGEQLEIYPFKYWGPHLFLLGEKNIRKLSSPKANKQG